MGQIVSFRSLAHALLGCLTRALVSYEASGNKLDPDAAETCARELLLRMLTRAQCEDLHLHGYFAVHVPGRGTFWILPSTFFNVLHMETGHCYCAVPRTEVPLSDRKLTQEPLLENDPKSFFAVANRRTELIPGPVAERLRPQRVLQARGSQATARIRCFQVSMLPHDAHVS